MFTIWKFHDLENKHDVCRGEDSMKMFCESLRKHAVKTVNFENNKMIVLKWVYNFKIKRMERNFIFK